MEVQCGEEQRGGVKLREERRGVAKVGEGMKAEKNCLRVQFGGERRMKVRLVKWRRLLLLCYG